MKSFKNRLIKKRLCRVGIARLFSFAQWGSVKKGIVSLLILTMVMTVSSANAIVKVVHLAETRTGWANAAQLTTDAYEGQFAIAWTPPNSQTGFLKLNHLNSGVDVSAYDRIAFWWKVEGEGLRDLKVKIRNYPLVGGMEAVYNIHQGGEAPAKWTLAEARLNRPDFDNWGGAPDLTQRYITFRAEVEPNANIRIFIDRIVVLPPTFTWTVGAPAKEPGVSVNGDFNGDGSVGFADFLLFARAFGSSAGDDRFDTRFDLDESGSVGFPDFITFSFAFGSGGDRWRVPMTLQSQSTDSLSVTIGTCTAPITTVVLPPETTVESSVLIPAFALTGRDSIEAYPVSIWGQVQDIFETRTHWTTYIQELQGVSTLWGESGELWSPTSRLPDFSRAGYHKGDRSIPDVPVVASVTDYGAVGDGITDDSAAFQRAVDSAPEGAIEIPAGRYALVDQVRITRPRIVLRGAGPNATVLVIPKSLQQLEPIDTFSAQGVEKLNYSFSGAFIEVRGNDGLSEIGNLTAVSERGHTQLVVENASRIRAGDWVQLRQTLNADLGRHIHAGQNAGDDTLARPRTIEWVAQVERVDGNMVEVDRPLRLDARPEWNASLHHYRPTVEEVGIEGLTFEFAGTEKKDHLLEEGFNAIQISDAFNSWVRNVRIIDADMGIKVSGVRHFQAEDLTFAQAKRTGMTGHHAIWAVSNAQDCLFQTFKIETTYIHDITVEGFANGVVFREGSGRAINLDHHRHGPYENLFTNLDVGEGYRLWRSSGRGDRGPHSGARTTAWNLRYTGDRLDGPPLDQAHWPLANVIGIRGYQEQRDKNSTWVESGAGEVAPVDLYISQRARRTATP